MQTAVVPTFAPSVLLDLVQAFEEPSDNVERPTRGRQGNHKHTYVLTIHGGNNIEEGW